MSQSADAPSFQWSFFHPRYIHTWLGVSLMYLLSWLPYRIQIALGRKLGLLVMIFLKKRKKITSRNLELCFPEMTLAQRNTLLKKNFENMGIALFETGMAWFWPDWRIKKHVTIVGLEHLAKLNESKKGALCIAIHSFNLELGARITGMYNPGYGVYRPNSNPVYNWVQYRGRSKNNKLISRTDIKQILKRLKMGAFLWYAPDHDYGHHRSTWAPFFAVEKACTITGTHFFASATKCHILTFTIVRNKNDTGYYLQIDEPVKDFPYHCKDEAAAYTNRLIERSIMRAPEQYMWLHRRFKSRPEGEPSLYD